MKIEYGNRTGKYFTEWRFQLLEELLGYVHESFIGSLSPNPPLKISDVKIWYDEVEDFHNLSFRSNGHCVEVRLYKVFSCKIDGEDGWIGCPRNQIVEFSNYLRKKLTEEENNNARI